MEARHGEQRGGTAWCDALTQVFQFLGGGRFLLVGSVCREWRRAYTRSHPRRRTSMRSICRSLELLKWGLLNGCPRHDKHLTIWAASCGSLDTLQRLRMERAPWDQRVTWAAAACGHLKVLQWAAANGCPLNERAVYAAAAAGGRLDVLQWLHGEGRACGAEVTWYAARHGHVEVLNWAHANGLAWSARAGSAAAKHNRPAVLQWARAKGLALESAPAAALQAARS
ncbi:hypothetical protein JKP88DRAFT_302385 [Tribonema minus]|uniref:Uncharacterized protein n=1 Tax=Tribonema minus TaxID=303371 RepID=A0A835Z7N9_9STRA|nr:hypothetical protein JKP88DRAFT_302385 [Tribonema minus]